MSESIISKDGALPTLNNASDEKILGVPSSRLKSKTNVGKFFYLIAFVGAGLFIIIGLLFFMKGRTNTTAAAQTIAKKVDQTRMKNDELLNGNIESKKKKLMQEEALNELQGKIEAAKVEVAKIEAAKGGTNNAGGSSINPMLSGAVSGPQSDIKVSIVATREEQLLAGDVLFGGTKEKVSAPRNTSTTEGQAPHEQSSFAVGSAKQLSQQFALAQQKYVDPIYSNLQSSNNADNANVTEHSQGPRNSLDSSLQPTVLQARNANRLGNLDFLLKKGTIIPCGLKTGIDTTLAGFVTCVAINDVYSANGKTLLIERGASVFGEQRSNVAQGQARVFVLWSRIDNPSGVSAELDSPATDQMGYNGIPGYLDNHFWQRFGGAILMSVINDSLAAVVAKQAANASNGNSVQITNTSSTSQSMAAEALRNTINIPPTITTLPARVVDVMVVRDISFESVYRLVK